MTGSVLNEHSSEALERTERCTVDHHRGLLRVVLSGVLQLEALREVVVDLDRTELPLTTDGILNHEVELRTIEGSLTELLVGVETLLLTSLTDSVLALLPDLVRTDILVSVLRVTERDLSIVVFETEDLEDLEDDVDDRLKLRLHLIGAHEDVGIVLGERTHTGQSVQLTALFITEDGTELSDTQRQILVGTGLARIDLTVVRAVHRLEHIFLVGFRSMDRLERVLAVVSIVTGSDVEVL